MLDLMSCLDEAPVEARGDHGGRTLTSEEVQSAQDAIVAALETELGARLRGPSTG
jgi:hypothetical protein